MTNRHVGVIDHADVIAEAFRGIATSKTHGVVQFPVRLQVLRAAEVEIHIAAPDAGIETVFPRVVHAYLEGGVEVILIGVGLRDATEIVVRRDGRGNRETGSADSTG